MAVVPEDSYGSQATFAPLFGEPLHLVCRNDDALAGGRDVARRDIPLDRLMLMDGLTVPQGLSLPFGPTMLRVKSTETLLQQVVDMRRCTVLPALAARRRCERDPNVAMVPIRGGALFRRIGVATRTNCPRIALLEVLCDKVRQSLPAGAAPRVMATEGAT